MRWKPPEDGILMFNVDGSARGSNGTVGIGGFEEFGWHLAVPIFNFGWH